MSAPVLNQSTDSEFAGACIINIVTGRGYTVREVVAEFERASGQRIPLTIAGRRAGNIDAYYAEAGLAHQLLGWGAKRDLQSMCANAWP